MSLTLIPTGGGWDRSCGSRPVGKSTGSRAKTGLGGFLAVAVLVLLGGCSAQRGCSGNLTHQEPGLEHRDWEDGRNLESIGLAEGDSPCWARALSQLPRGNVNPVLLDHLKVC